LQIVPAGKRFSTGFGSATAVIASVEPNRQICLQACAQNPNCKGVFLWIGKRCELLSDIGVYDGVPTNTNSESWSVSGAWATPPAPPVLPTCVPLQRCSYDKEVCRGFSDLGLDALQVAGICRASFRGAPLSTQCSLLW